jgi:hypothetical protein
MPNSYNALAVAFADFDADGNVDLVVGRDLEPVVLLGDGAGRFVPAPPAFQPAGSERNLHVVAADLDGDARVDLALCSSRALVGFVPVSHVELHANVGGAWDRLNPTRLPRVACATQRVWLVDDDRDGDLDVWRAGALETPLLRNDGDGWFTPAGSQQLALPAGRVQVVAIADVDADGDPEAWVGLVGG